jgi:hypothetical protein
VDSGDVGIVTGKASLGMFPSKNPRYKLEIGYFEFEIPGDALKIIVKGDIYTVYYSPQSKSVLSIEKPSSQSS